MRERVVRLEQAIIDGGQAGLAHIAGSYPGSVGIARHRAHFGSFWIRIGYKFSFLSGGLILHGWF
jgi:hypothetical protein